MNKTEILNIVNEPSKHIQIVKIDGKDSIVYSSKFVELLELIPTMLTKADMVAMLTELQTEIEENVLAADPNTLLPFLQARETCVAVIQEKINKLRGKENE